MKMEDENNSFTCESCHQTFLNGWSDKEAEDEQKELFPNLSKDDRAIVCDDCFKEIMGYN